MSSIHLLQLSQVMYSFSTGSLPTKFDSFSLLIMVFIVTTQGALHFFGYLFAGQIYGGFQSPFKALNFSVALIMKLKIP